MNAVARMKRHAKEAERAAMLLDTIGMAVVVTLDNGQTIHDATLAAVDDRERPLHREGRGLRGRRLRLRADRASDEREAGHTAGKGWRVSEIAELTPEANALLEEIRTIVGARAYGRHASGWRAKAREDIETLRACLDLLKSRLEAGAEIDNPGGWLHSTYHHRREELAEAKL